MSETQKERFTKDMEAQGVRVTRTKKGLLLRLPDGGTYMKHFTDSDHRGAKNTAAALKRAGITMPGTRTADLPPYITEGTIKQSTKDRVYNWVRKVGYPGTIFAKDYCEEEHVDPGSANRHLYHAGFIAKPEIVGRKGRPWLTPEWLVEEGRAKRAEAEDLMMNPPVVPDIIDRARKAQEAINELGAGKPVQFDPPLTKQEAEAYVEAVAPEPEVDRFGTPVEEQSVSPEPREVESMPIYDEPAVEPPIVVQITQEQAEDIQYIDTRDSWVVDLEELLGGHLFRMFSERLSVLKVVGIDYEMRVWRK
jgi:hypothetical protein